MTAKRKTRMGDTLRFLTGLLAVVVSALMSTGCEEESATQTESPITCGMVFVGRTGELEYRCDAR